MALESKARNMFGDRMFGDISNIFITIVSGATPRDPARSSPDTTVTDATSGVYTFTYPKSTFTLVAGCNQIGQAVAVNANITAFSAANGTGTVTLSDAGALGAGEEIHLQLVGCAP